MKILLIRNYPSYMSVKNTTYNIQEVGLAKALVRKGNVCDILFWTDRQEEMVTIPVENKGEIHVFYRKGISILKNTIYVGCKQMFEQYDILQPSEYNQMQAWLLAKNEPNKTIIYHGPYYSLFNKRYNLMCKVFDTVFLKQYIKQDTKFLTKSKMAKEFLVKKGIKAENVTVAGVGIDTKMLSTKQEDCKEPLYQAMKNDNSNLKLLYIGRFEKRRNIFFIIDVFKKVLLQNPNAKLYMIGTGEKEYLDQLFSYVENCGVQDKVIWQEKMQQKYLSNVYSLSDFFLLPTEYEIFGMVLLEAMYYSTVVLTTYNGGSSTLIENGINGYILDSDDVERWSGLINELAGNRNAMYKIKQKAHETVALSYTWDTLAESFLKQYDETQKVF